MIFLFFKATYIKKVLINRSTGAPLKSFTSPMLRSKTVLKIILYFFAFSPSSAIGLECNFIVSRHRIAQNHRTSSWEPNTLLRNFYFNGMGFVLTNVYDFLMREGNIKESVESERWKCPQVEKALYSNFLVKFDKLSIYDFWLKLFLGWLLKQLSRNRDSQQQEDEKINKNKLKRQVVAYVCDDDSNPMWVSLFYVASFDRSQWTFNVSK